MTSTTTLPKAGEKWEHVDGGTLYVVSVTGGQFTDGPYVYAQRRPFGDSFAEREWLTLAKFNRLARFKLA